MGAASGIASAAVAGGGAASRRHRVRTRPESRCSCAAHGGTAARRPPVLRHVSAGGCRAGHRRAQDLIGQDLAALGGLFASSADGGPVGGSAHDHVLFFVGAERIHSSSAWRGRGSLQGLRLGQASTARTVKQTVDIPVPHSRGGRAGHGGLQGVSQGQGSTASSSSSHVRAGAVDEPFQGFFFALFSKGKKCGVGSALGVGTGCGLFSMDSGGLCRVHGGR